MIWAMLNRYGLFTRRYYPRFHQFLRAYSTPLQTVLKNAGAARSHMKNSDFVRATATIQGPRPRSQLGRFLRSQRTPWDRLPEGAQVGVSRQSMRPGRIVANAVRIFRKS